MYTVMTGQMRTSCKLPGGVGCEILDDADARQTLGDYATYVAADGAPRTLLLNAERVVVLTRRQQSIHPRSHVVMGIACHAPELRMLTEEDVAYCRRHGLAYDAARASSPPA
jgi:hypothetical protein